MLLQILEDGNLADAKGRRVDFRNTIIIMTSNVGADQITRDMTFGFQTAVEAEKKAAQDYNQMKDRVMEQLKRTFRPEFLNRIDGIIVFHPLTTAEIREIVNLETKRIRAQLQEQEIALEITDKAMDLLGERGYDRQYGARPLRRIIQNLIEDPLAEGLLSGRYKPGTEIKVDVEDDLLRIITADDLAPVA
jgi:ATP-dependent Clp protease ATP-binding subunit ClpC